MNRLSGSVIRAALGATSVLGCAMVAVTPAAAQLTTSTVRGTVTDQTGTPISGGQVTATNTGTAAARRATTDAKGQYVLSGVAPGTYNFVAQSAAGQSPVQQARVQVAQTVTLNLVLGAPTPTEAGSTTITPKDIVVVGSLQETRTSEVGTNVTQTQIENLPQNNRNFLNFANLAPGITVANNDTRRTFSGGGVGSDPNGESLGGPQVNVFIDGVSLKSNLQQGGIVGQDGSRGNPFSQLAVQEFRVITSNYKAEYEDAGTAIITAVTKSGTNEFHGEAFGTFQNKSLIERDFIQKRDNLPKPDLSRYQFGAALGGPIIKDKLFFFVNYEGNIQDRSQNVVPDGDAARQAAFTAATGLNLADFRGSFASPFREHLGFGKLTWQVDDNQLVELTGSIRKESDLRDFGGAQARSRGSDINNSTYTGKLRHQYTGNSLINEATFDYLKADLRFGNAAGDSFALNYQGVINIGGRPDFQRVRQEGYTFRDNLTLTNLGAHTVKGGIKYSYQKYNVGGSGPFANPQFDFVIDQSNNLDFTLAQQVNFGIGNPTINAHTNQIGVFVQDDWQATDQLLFNLGIRWDYDSNTRNNSFATPSSAVAALQALGQDPRIGNFFNVNDYISTGKNRGATLNQFQPRVGFSYEMLDESQAVIFGGYGRYYDRVLFRNAAEESLLTQYQRGSIQFSKDGTPRNGQPTIQFQPNYMTQDGFQTLLSSIQNDNAAPGTSELRVIPNDLRSPHTDQFSLGVRQRIGVVRTSVTYNYIIGSDQVGYAPLNRSQATNAAGFYDFIPLINGYSNVVAAFNTRATRFHGVYVTVDKPYTKSSHYGFGLAYTLAFSKERGFAFNFDFPNISARPYVPNAGDVRHKLVLNGMVDLPLDLQMSGLATISSPTPFAVIDASQGFGARDIQLLGNIGHLPAFVQIDLRLKKDVRVFGGDFYLQAEVFNLFNRANFTGADGFIPPEGNANFGRPNAVAYPPRSFQFGAGVRF